MTLYTMDSRFCGNDGMGTELDQWLGKRSRSRLAT